MALLVGWQSSVMGASAAYGAMALSTFCIVSTLFYIPTFIGRIQSIQNGLTLSMDEFNVMQVSKKPFYETIENFRMRSGDS